MSDLLSIGASGVRAYQTALSTVSENIANVGTVGYSRRTTDMREIAAGSAGVTGNRQLTSNGVYVAGIARQADVYRAQAVRDSSADLARTDTAATALTGIEQALSGSDLGDRITGFFNSAKTLAADPTSVPARTVLLETATAAAAAFRQGAQALTRATADLDAGAQASVATLNSLGSALAKVNDGLGRSQPGSSQAAELMDQRDQLTQQMSTISDVDVRYDAVGRAEVKLGGAGGPSFVKGSESGAVAMSRNDEGAVEFTLVANGTGQAMSPGGGALAGVVEGAQRIADATKALDTLATDFAKDMNAVQAGGADLDGKKGAAIFADVTTAAAMAVTMTDPRGIAAAATGSPAGSRDATNLAALQTRRTAGGYEATLTRVTTANASALEQKKLVAGAQTAIRDNAVATQSAASGVDLDSEAVDLMRFQQAYQASSRVIQASREIFQSILDIR